MAKITVKQSNYNVKLPGQDGHLLRIWKDEKEPPKNYLWDYYDELLVWYCNDWIPVYDFLKNPYYKCDCEMEEDRLTKMFNRFKEEMLAQLRYYFNLGYNLDNITNEKLRQMIEDVGCGGSIDEDDVEQIMQLLRAEMQTLSSDLSANLEQTNNRVDKNANDINALETRTGNLETSSNNTTQNVSNLGSRVDGLETSVSKINNDINTINEFIDSVDDIDHSQFITATEQR